MKAIITKYIGATNHKPSRIKISAEGTGSVIMSYSVAEDKAGNTGGTYEAHKAAADTYKTAHNWKGELIGGGLPDNTGYAFVFKE